jgi:hypothetical protein
MSSAKRKRIFGRVSAAIAAAQTEMRRRASRRMGG